MCQQEPTAKAVRACMQRLSQAVSSERDLAEASSLLRWAMVALGFSCIALCSLSLWFVFELAYIEKKAAKHTRRHRHNKHHIPWHKIKVCGRGWEKGPSVEERL